MSKLDQITTDSPVKTPQMQEKGIKLDQLRSKVDQITTPRSVKTLAFSTEKKLREESFETMEYIRLIKKQELKSAPFLSRLISELAS